MTVPKWGNYTDPIYTRTIEDVQALIYRIEHSATDADLDTQLYERGSIIMLTHKLVWVYHEVGTTVAKPTIHKIDSPPWTVPNKKQPGQLQTYWLAIRKVKPTPKPRKRPTQL